MHGGHLGGRSVRQFVATVAALVTAVGLASLAPAAQGQGLTLSAENQQARIYRAGGRPLSARSDAAPSRVVRDFLKAHGASRETVASLRVVTPVWKTQGVSHLRMAQEVGGLRVHDTYVKAAFDTAGRLVDLIENVAPVNGSPTRASIGPEVALVAAVEALYPGRSVDSSGSSRSGNTTTFRRDGFYTAPTVEKVAVPTQGDRLAVAFVVTTWNAENNHLYESQVSGDGVVVSQDLRSAEDNYNIFPVNPEATSQTIVSGRGAGDGNEPSPDGWLAGTQKTIEISGNNAHAYLDTNNDNQPDAGGTSATSNFLTSANLSEEPSTTQNQAVAVQNLFYLNNLIHDTLYRAGFNEAAGNFQVANYRHGGRSGDPVQAEAQDGGGTDNANFATPRDGSDPRMQMYLWKGVGTHQVIVNHPASIAGTYVAAGADWGSQLDTTGLTGGVVLANDGTDATTDACESVPAVTSGGLLLADRGTCGFVVKAKNAQNAGAAGIIVANDQGDTVFRMGGQDSTVTIPGVMIGQTDGGTLKSEIGAGEDATIRLADPPPLMRDSAVDSDLVWHEYGHGLTWRMIGQMNGPVASAIGEGMSDVLAVVVNNDPVIGEYAAGNPSGIRRHSYEGYDQFQAYNQTGTSYGDLTWMEPHNDGELYGAIGWDLWKQYLATFGQRATAQTELLADLVNGMNFTPSRPTFEQMRDGILAGLRDTGNDARSCMVWKSFAKYGVGQGAKAKVSNRVSVTESFITPPGC